MLGTNVIGSPVVIGGMLFENQVWLAHFLTHFAIFLILATTFSFVATRLVRLLAK